MATAEFVSPDAVAASYPVQIRLDWSAHPNRFWAVPILGSGIKSIMAIPHLVLLTFVGIWVFLNHLVLWTGVLFGGQYSERGFALTEGYLRWLTRLAAWALGVTDVYPPFSLKGDAAYPVDVTAQLAAEYKRFWAVPVLGCGIKTLILIPHAIITQILIYGVSICSLVLWIPVLFGGAYPQWGKQLVGGTLAWYTRVYAYQFGLTDKYPPFSMGYAV